MTPCRVCGALPILNRRLAYGGPTAIYNYTCPRCGFAAGCYTTGYLLTGHTVTDQEAIERAADKWERGISLEAERQEIKRKMGR